MNALKNKLEKQKIQPSAGSWDKLSASLDAYQVPKRKPKFVFYYWGVAAAVLVLVGFLFLVNIKWPVWRCFQPHLNNIIIYV